MLCMAELEYPAGIGVVDGSESTGAIVTKAASTQSRWVRSSTFFLICLLAYAERSNFAVASDRIVKNLGITPTQIGLATTLFSLGYAISYYYADGKRLVGETYGWNITVLTLSGAAALGIIAISLVQADCPLRSVS
jgi:hypothetical protein